MRNPERVRQQHVTVIRAQDVCKDQFGKYKTVFQTDTGDDKQVIQLRRTRDDLALTRPSVEKVSPLC